VIRITGIRRRQFLVATGVVLAETAYRGVRPAPTRLRKRLHGVRTNQGWHPDTLPRGAVKMRPILTFTP